MPANLAAMLRSMLKARQAASVMELRFLREVARALSATRLSATRALSTTSANGSPRKAAGMTLRRSLKCPRCDRRFAMPVHLGRHLSATHGRKMKRAA